MMRLQNILNRVAIYLLPFQSELSAALLFLSASVVALSRKKRGDAND